MYSQIAANKRKSVFLIIMFLLLISALGYGIGWWYGNPSISVAVLIGASVYAFIMYFASARLALAMNGAHQINKQDDPRYYRIVENLAMTEGLPMPKVYVMDDPAPNAFATGRNPQHGVVAATTGLLQMMEDDELEGVIAHELGHIKNYDIRVSMVAMALAAIVTVIADAMLRLSWFGGGGDDEDAPSNNQLFFFLAIIAVILAPLAATMIQLAISRRREYLADATGALTTRYPEGLARALEKIGAHGSSMRRQNTATAHLFFANPLSGKSFLNLFSTHPPVTERVKVLREMGNTL